MSTYRNPVTVIDRESGKIWANAINTLSEQALRKREKKEAEQNSEQKRMQQLFAQEADYLLNHQEKFAQAASVNGINNPSLFEAGQELITDMAKASTKIRTATTQEERQIALNNSSKLQKLYTGLIQIVKTGGDADQTYVKDRINTGVSGWKAPGEQGGMSITGKKTEAFINRMNVRTGAGMGATEKYVRKADNSGWDLQYTGGRFGDTPTTVDALFSLSYDPGLVPDLKGQVDSIFRTDSAEGEDGKTFAILQQNGEYNEQYLDLENTVYEDGSVDEDGSFRRTELAPANSALIASVSTTKLNNIVNNYLSSPDQANKIYMEVLPNNEAPLERSLDGSITPKAAEEFRRQVLEYGRKQLPNYNIIGQETVIDYQKRLGSRIKEIKKEVPDKADKTPKAAETLLNDLIEDTPGFLARYMDEDNFSMTEGPGGKGFTVTDGKNSYTYDLTKGSDIIRFFRLEIPYKSKKEQEEILEEITKSAGKYKKNIQTSEYNAPELIKQYSN